MSRESTSAEPKCPDCNVQGTKHITSTASTETAKNGNPWFHIVYCSGCGHVYGVIAKHVFGARSGPTLVVPDRR